MVSKWCENRMSYPKRCCVCSEVIGQTLHACCEWEWSKTRKSAGRFETYNQECEAFSKWYVEDFENRGVVKRW